MICELKELWEAVIRQALTDAASRSIDPAESEEARNWLTIPNKDFDLACELANKCPIRTRREAIRTLAELDARPKRAKRQCKCQRLAKTYSFEGQTLTLRQWADVKDLPLTTIRGRLSKGWSLERILSTPLRATFNHSEAPGEGDDLKETHGTGVGSIAHDFSETDFPKEELTP